MSGDRRERLKRFLLEVESASEEARAALIERLRAEDALLAAEAESLLAQRTRDELEGKGLTEALRAALPGAAHEIPRPSTRRVGPYELLELIGTGGMGAVYRARQEEPIRREVAVKLLRGGLDPARVLARFEEERRALALADHPGIARILDAGSDEAGTPYLVMELVRGTPITEFCRGKRGRETLDLFVTVCRAVQHAHQKGIIHRDLKPSNILVSEVDGKPTVKVIDFGIARVVEEGSSGRVSLTGEGQIIGTLEYMSPEQASGRSREIDTRTDVYSLGAVLYELLTGSVPHDLSGKSLTEAIDTIRKDPLRPFRETGMGRRPDSDLETITRKALEAEPGRRYDGPGALADDVERYLRSEPIVARPPSTTYQLRKMVQRHRTAVTVGGAVLGLLLIFGVTMSVLYAGQRRERERAEREAAKAEAVNRFLQEMLASADPAQMGVKVTVREVIDRSLGSLDRTFAGQKEVHSAVLATLGTTYHGLGAYPVAESLLQASIRIRRSQGVPEVKLGPSLLEMARVRSRMGRFDDAERTARDVLERAERETGRTSEETAWSLLLLGGILNERGGRYEEAESLLTRSARLWSALGKGDSPESGDAVSELASLAWSRGDHLRSDSLQRQALSIYQRHYGEVHPKVENSVSELAITALDDARKDSLYRVSVDLAERLYGRDHPLVGMRKRNRAGWLWHRGSLEESETLIRDALGTYHATLGPDHPWTGDGHTFLANVLRSQGRLDSAEKEMRLGLSIQERSWGPENLHLSGKWMDLGLLLADKGALDEARMCLQRGIDITVKSAGGRGGFVANAMLAMGTFHLEYGSVDSADLWSRRALESYPDDPRRDRPAAGRCAIGVALWKEGRRAEAEPYLVACEMFRNPDKNVAMRWEELCRIVRQEFPTGLPRSVASSR